MISVDFQSKLGWCGKGRGQKIEEIGMTSIMDDPSKDHTHLSYGDFNATSKYISNFVIQKNTLEKTE